LVATEKDDLIIAPAENVQDKIAFIFNNLSQVNLQTKVNICKFFFFLENMQNNN
jgi:CCR4-NOT transcription complex subunit 1